MFLNNIKKINLLKMSKLSKSEISDLDKWIEQLRECQPLEESQVKTLCEKVISLKLN